MPSLFPWRKKPDKPNKGPACAVTNEDLLTELWKGFNALAATQRKLMATQDEIAAQLTDARAQIAKVRVEQETARSTAEAAVAGLNARITELEAVIAAGGQASEPVVTALAALKAELQSFDDTIADAPVV